MKQGLTLTALAEEVTRQRDQKRDFLAPCSVISMDLERSGEGRRGIPAPLVPTLMLSDQKFFIKETAHQQIANYTGIPKPYYDRMLETDPTLLMTNVNRWMKTDDVRMVRTLDGSARALLSDRFRPLDNDALLEAALPPLISMGVEIMSCQVTDTRLYLKVVDKRIMKDIPTGRRLGDGSHVFFDTVSPALVLTNSEVGHGSLAVHTSIYTHLCTNLAVVAERSTRKYHVGQRLDVGEDTYQLLSDDTRRLTDAALWAQVGDVVKAAFDQVQFDAVADRFGEAAEDKIEGDAAKVVEITAKKFDMSQHEKSSVLQHLIMGGDLTRYGLHSAVTRTAEDLPDYDRASLFEELGGKIIELPKSEWRELARAA